MKKLTKILSAILLTTALSVQSASAANMYLKMKGTADHDALGVTLLVLNKGVSVNNITNNDIKYIDQGDINADGSFELRLPFFTEQEYDFYSNMSYTMNVPGNPTKTVYVSDSGTEKNTGESADSPITLAQAWKYIDEIKEIVLAGDTTYTEAPAHISNLTIKAESASTVLALGSDVSLNGDTTFSNLTLSGAKTIYANGYALKIDETVTSTDRLNVYGGANGTAIDGDTNITLLGGLYSKVYGGGNGTAATINGSTNVTISGNVNAGDTNDDDASNYYKSIIYGGGAGSPVTGKTNVNVAGNAVAAYIFGAGTGTNGTAVDTNININGGKVMNVFGGSESSDTVLTNCDTHVTITDGLAEAIFGGSQNSNLTGNTYVNLLGGDVSRRVYTGCYNKWELSWESSNYVNGTTTLSIAPEVALNTKTGLSSGNQTNIGVYSGSRTESNLEEEKNTIIFLNDSYATHKNKLDTSTTIVIDPFKSFHDYIVKAGKGGTVKGTGTGGEVYIAPDAGNYGAIGNNKYFNENAPISEDTTVTFAKEFSINSIAQPTDTTAGISTNVDVTAENFSKEEAPYMVVAVYDNGMLVSCDLQETPASNTAKEFNINCKLESGKTYLVKAMLWNKNQKPLTASYSITVNK